MLVEDIIPLRHSIRIQLANAFKWFLLATYLGSVA